ncbi:hypothetical protein GJ744_011592 [Endocarpon pusillum]|uniref:Uncharacterized protein n=1 Tax=Endocarpon pusillum TaxID=364733 RepID=A0A8H7AK26_9EURO|nr:hypothetical protein GJ744_011592 [Endocarpon pusillum]
MVFGLGTISVHGSFAASTIAVYNNVAKQVLFKLAALFLQLFIFKLFALLAASRKAFTSYLMFTEDYIQRTLYIFSRGFSSGGIIVFSVTILLFVGTWFDALLWGLDSPGYLAKKSNVTAAKIADRLLPEPGYLVFSNSIPGDIAPLDARLVEMMGANLFQPGVNFTLTGVIDRGTPKTVAATRPFEEVGPRIWLDHDGFSVSADTFTTFSANNTNAANSLDCPWQTMSDTVQSWNCTFDNSFALQLASQNILGRPEVHWDDVTDKRFQSQYISPTREDNPWDSLGKGGDTALMKQMFTVTKGRMRHTFVETAFKACMITEWLVPFSLEEVTDLVKRAWSTDPADQSNPIISKVAQSIIDARSRNSSGVFGLTAETETSVSQVNYELLNVEYTPDRVGYSLFRASVVNIMLVRSDELPEPVVPLEPCDRFYMNIALGGKVRKTDCYLSSVGNFSQEGHRFYGQVDTSAFLILNGVLGEGRFNYSDKALNQQAFEWAVNNDEKLSNLVLSRGAILALGPANVMVEVTSIQPAVSPLQMMLIAICAVLAGVSWLCLIFFAKAHYSSSLLANLIATTMITTNGEDVKSGKPRYLADCPEINLTHENGPTTLMVTATGVFKHVNFMDQGAGESFISQNRNEDGIDEIGMAKTTAISQYEVVKDQEYEANASPLAQEDTTHTTMINLSSR